MWEQFRKYSKHLIAAAILLIAFIFYSLNLKDKEHANLFERTVLNISSPLFSVIASINTGASGIWKDYLDLVEVRKENKILRESVKVLNSRIIESREALLANERLNKLLGIKNSLHTPSLAAKVIGEDSSPWFKTILINRGAGDGLKEGMPVIASDGIIGQLVKVAEGSSRVLLITDHASGVAGIIQRSRARGVVKGKGDGTCSLEFSLATEDVTVGDTVITSGIGGIFPKGLNIGEVSMVKKGEYGIFQTVEIRPTVNLARLEEVLVLLQQSRE
jgi:rod shape-determining protein MreC